MELINAIAWTWHTGNIKDRLSLVYLIATTVLLAAASIIGIACIINVIA